MFEGRAVEALDLYERASATFIIESEVRYDADEEDLQGTAREARASLGGHRLVIIDSPISHAFDFTPAVSLFVDFETRRTLEAACGSLSDDRSVLMLPDDDGFSAYFAWVTDRFGLSWQLNPPRGS